MSIAPNAVSAKTEIRPTKGSNLPVWRLLVAVLSLGLAGRAVAQSQTNGTLGPNFTGTNIETLISRVRAIPPKSEFETDRQYAQRTALSGDSPLLSFVLSAEPRDSWVDFTYDPDSQTMAVTIQGLWCERLHLHPSGSDVCYTIVSRKLISKRQYAARNTFGAATTVTETVTDEYGVALDPSSTVFGLRVHSPTFWWSMDIATARAAKPFLKAALYGRQSSNELYDDVRGKEATLDSPFDITDSIFLLPVKVDALVIFNTKTGAVIKRFEASSNVR